jgi:predicted metal-dependent hydrolase
LWILFVAWELLDIVWCTVGRLRNLKRSGDAAITKRHTFALNTELVKKPKDLLENVIVHEMVHVIEPTNSDRFIAILREH